MTAPPENITVEQKPGTIIRSQVRGGHKTWLRLSTHEIRVVGTQGCFPIGTITEHRSILEILLDRDGLQAAYPDLDWQRVGIAILHGWCTSPEDAIDTAYRMLP